MDEMFPRVIDVPTIPRFPEIRLPLSTTNPARWAYEQIVRQIVHFEAELDREHEIGARLVSFGPGELIYIENVGCVGPHFIVFYGRNVDGNPAQLIQHVSQTNVLLVAAQKQHEEPERIGFKLAKAVGSTAE